MVEAGAGAGDEWAWEPPAERLALEEGDGEVGCDGKPRRYRGQAVGGSCVVHVA